MASSGDLSPWGSGPAEDVWSERGGGMGVGSWEEGRDLGCLPSNLLKKEYNFYTLWLHIRLNGRKEAHELGCGFRSGAEKASTHLDKLIGTSQVLKKGLQVPFVRDNSSPWYKDFRGVGGGGSDTPLQNIAGFFL